MGLEIILFYDNKQIGNKWRGFSSVKLQFKPHCIFIRKRGNNPYLTLEKKDLFLIPQFSPVFSQFLFSLSREEIWKMGSFYEQFAKYQERRKFKIFKGRSTNKDVTKRKTKSKLMDSNVLRFASSDLEVSRLHKDW